MTDIYYTEYGDIKVSPDEARRLRLLYEVDTIGYQRHPLFIKELTALRDHIETTAKMIWERR